MEIIYLVSVTGYPMRAFKNRSNAVSWIKDMSKQYKIKLLNFNIQKIIMYTNYDE